MKRALSLLVLVAAGCNDFGFGNTPGFAGGGGPVVVGPPPLTGPLGRLLPAANDLGTVEVGQARFANLLIRNEGDQPLVVTSAEFNIGQFDCTQPCEFFVTSAPLNDPIAPGDERTVQIVFAPTQSGEAYGMLHVVTNQFLTPFVEADLFAIADGPPTCSATIISSLEIDPGDRVRIDVTHTGPPGDVTLTSSLAAPPGSTAALIGVSPDLFEVVPVVAGRYDVELTVTDAQSRSSTCGLGFDALPDDRLYAQLLWDTDAGAELDLIVVDDTNGAVRENDGGARGPAIDDFAGLLGEHTLRARSNGADDAIATLSLFAFGALRAQLVFPVPPAGEVDVARVVITLEDVCIDDLTDGDSANDLCRAQE